MNKDEIIANAFKSAKAEQAPSVDVTTEVMRDIRHRTTNQTSTFERQLRIDAIVAVALALLVLIPAQRAAATLMDPMVAFFATVESALR